MSARGFVNLRQLAEVLEEVAEAEERTGSRRVRASGGGTPRVRQFPWDIWRLEAALALTEAEINNLSRCYFDLNQQTPWAGGSKTEELRPRLRGGT